jgi:hypothetical protein
VSLAVSVPQNKLIVLNGQKMAFSDGVACFQVEIGFLPLKYTVSVI